MPTASDLVTDLPADFETFGQAVATSMADLLGGTTGQILSKASNTDMDFTWVTNDVGDITAVTAGTGISGGGTSGAVTITNSMATAITSAGDLIKGTGSGTFDRLGIGSTGQVLTVSGGAPVWASPAGGGKVLQVVSTTYSTTTTTTATTFADTGLSLSITPSATSSKILVIANVPYNVEDPSGSFVFGNFNIVRGSTQIWTASTQQYGGEYGAISYVVVAGNASMHYLDSPSTTSATTYKIQMQNGGSGQNMRAQAASGTSVITLMEIGA